MSIGIGGRPAPTTPAGPSPDDGPRVGRIDAPTATRRGARVAPSTAVVMRPLLAALPVVLFLIPSLLVGLTRQPTYTSEARLLLGGFNVRSAAVPGFVDASRTLAATYARLVDTEVIVQPTAAAMGLPRDQVAGHISASPVPDSAIIKVVGSAKNDDDAIALAVAATAALREYVSNAGGSNKSEELAAYRTAVRARSDAQTRKVAIERIYAAAPTEANRQALADATADFEVAQIDAAREAERFNGAGSGGADLRVIAPPNTVTSDRIAKLQLFVAAPVLLGVVVGIALATLVVNRPELARASRGRARRRR